jgi:Ca2+-binding EF-hand superfamily protein
MSFSNFLATMTQEMFGKSTEEEILKVLKLFDDNETGKILFKNLKCVAKGLRERFTDEKD